MRHVVLIFRHGRKFFPVWIIPKGFPVVIPVRLVFETRHVHKVWHLTAGDHRAVKDCVKVQPFEQTDLIALVKHVNFILKFHFRGAFIAS